MKNPRFTDLHAHKRPYSTAAESEKTGYLRDKFRRIASDQREEEERRRREAEKMATVTKIKERSK